MEAVAKLRNSGITPRKMRMVADLIRGKRVNLALNTLRFEPKAGAREIEKLLLSAVANWEAKNPELAAEIGRLEITKIWVDAGRTLKRIQPAPQGRAHRILKRSNHVTLVVDIPRRDEDVVADVAQEIASEQIESADTPETKNETNE
jgi:large subunit ribosomal protein L22